MTRPAPPPLAHLLTAALVWLAAVGSPLVGCGPGGAAAQDDPARGDSTGQYVVGGVFDDVTGAVTTLVNGLPVGGRLGFMAALAPGTGVDTYMTPALVSGRNTASVEVVPFLTRAGGSVAPLPVRLRLWVEAPDGSVVAGTERGAAHVDSVVAAWTRELRSRWAGWMRAEDSVFAARPGLLEALVDSAESGARSAAYGVGPALDSARAWAARNPVRVATAFARPGGGGDGQPAFDAVVRDAPVIRGTAADSTRLRAFAVEFRDRVVARDTSLRAVVRPSTLDAFAATGEPAPADAAVAQAWATAAEEGTGWFMWGPGALAFGASDVGLRSWAGGRVWELYRLPGGGPLFEEQTDPAASVFQEVYVGEGPDGELRVVRTRL